VIEITSALQGRTPCPPCNGVSMSSTVRHHAFVIPAAEAAEKPPLNDSAAEVGKRITGLIRKPLLV